MTGIVAGIGFKAIAGSAVQGVVKFLRSLSFWQLVSLVLAVVIAVQHFTIIHDRAEAAKWQKQYSALESQVKKQATESKAQQKQVSKTVDHYITVTKPEVRTVVKRIESAPLPGNCKTPPQVLGADV